MLARSEVTARGGMLSASVIQHPVGDPGLRWESLAVSCKTASLKGF